MVASEYHLWEKLFLKSSISSNSVSVGHSTILKPQQAYVIAVSHYQIFALNIDLEQSPSTKRNNTELLKYFYLM